MKDWIKKLLSSSAVASYSRTSSAVSLLVFLSLDVLFYLSGHALPGRDSLMGQALFIGALYTPGKIGETIGKFSGDKGDQ